MVSNLKKAAASAIVDAAKRIRPGAPLIPPAKRTVLDDIAMRRPWNLVVKAARLWARRPLRRLRPGVTVVIVNWNTAEVVRDVITAVQKFSPDDTRILVLDNGSTDSSREFLVRRDGIDVLLLPANAGHGAALDIAMCKVATKVAVVLDSDAVPLRRGWLDPAVLPVANGKAVLSGTRSSRDFVHPVFLAVDVRIFLSRGLSFQIFLLPGVNGTTAAWGYDAWDTGELLTSGLPAQEVAFISQTPDPPRSEDLPGGFVADLVYHHGGMTRESEGGGLSAEAVTGWRTALKALNLTQHMDWSVTYG